MSRLLCPNKKCKGGNLKWITDIEADDLLEKGIIECQTCKEIYVGISGWEKSMKENK